jgi:cephalosporin hydroxylase
MNQNTESQLNLPGNKTIEEHLWDGYLTWFYHTNVWKQMTWHGIRTLKLPSDMWNYQEIIHERKVDWVIEAGTRHGGSALFFAEALAARNAQGKVISMDIDAAARQLDSHEKIEFLIGDSGAQAMVDRVTAMLPEKRGPIFLILDSDHACAHVLRELEVWVPFLRAGDYLLVEDGDINGHPVRPDFGPGPYEAVEQFIAKYPNVLSHDKKRERKFGCTQAPLGHFIKN